MATHALAFLLFLLPACQAPQAARTEGPQLAAGPMVGHTGPRHARIWAQAPQPGWVVAEYREPGTDFWIRSRFGDGRERRAHFDPTRGFTAVCEIHGLQPGRSYEYRLVTKLGPLPVLSEQLLRTPPEPGQAEDFVLAFGSCAGDWGPDPSQPVFRAIDRLNPQVFLWLGDNIYFARKFREWDDAEKMAARWQAQRALPNLQPLLRRTSHYAIWDDHDYGPDNSDKLYPLKDRSLDLFTWYWANPAYGTDGQMGVWHRFTRGRVEFFLLDARYWRDPDWMEPGPDKTQLGPVQWAWLERSLSDSQADFKVIVSSGQVLARYHQFESWDLYPADRERLLGLIRRQSIGGVLILSGDRHSGEVLRWMPPDAPYPLYEITSSPLAAGIGATLPDALVADRVDGTMVAEENFGVLRFEFGAEGGPRVLLSARDTAGQTLYPEVVVPLSVLQP